MPMTESILKALMRLFGIVTQIHSDSKLLLCRAIVESYLQQMVNPSRVNQYLIMYDFYQSSLREREIKTGQKQMSLFSVKAIIICENINKVLDKRQKLLVLMQLLEILNVGELSADEDVDFVRTISIAFKFDPQVFNNCKSFILDTLYEIPDKDSVLIIDSKQEKPFTGIKHLYREYLKGRIIFLSVDSANSYLFRNIDGDDRLNYKGKDVIPYRTYFLEKGSAIRNPLVGTIYYSNIVREFLYSKTDSKINLAVQQLEYRFPNSNDGIHPFSMYEESGTMVGIMGGSGVGKSTLLNLFNGRIKPRSGRVLINGYNVYREKESLSGTIGFIPQDDLLVEELTVYQNLYYNAKLCFDQISEDEIDYRINKMLSDIGLHEARDLKVGNPLNTYISGGQRKRLNIALELIREPSVLFVDEPTSGLSSADSDIVIDLLREQSLKGKLVVINIHQPSSDTYKRFDKLIVMDKGGRIIFHGNPLDALVYFKTENQLINADDGECPTCGNVNPEQVLQIIESKQVNEYGEYISSRQISAEDWYDGFKKKLEQKVHSGCEIKVDLPSTNFQIPGKVKQFRIFYLRNFFTKLSDKQYLLVNLLEAPLLAFILGWFTKYNAGREGDPEAYLFSQNVNLPVYIFMAVIVALFMGLMVSAEEIVRDRKLLQREAFLNLSRISYYNSKIVFLLVISALQTLVFVLIGNSILEIQGMFFHYWLMLFVCSFLANLVGLNISAVLKSVVAIYIMIPLLLVPQILLGGAMIRFEKLNSKLTNPKYVPFVGDMIPSRWAYEALAVYQFKNNSYQKYFFDVDRTTSEAAYKINLLLPELSLKLNTCENNIKINQNYTQVANDLILLKNEISTIGKQFNSLDQSFLAQLNHNDFNGSTANRVRYFIEASRRIYGTILEKSIEDKDNRLLELKSGLGGIEALLEFKNDNFNFTLEDMMLSKKETIKIVEYDNRLIRKDEPIYKIPENNFGRAHFFSAEKRVANIFLETYWFNLLILLLMALVFYVLLVSNILRFIVEFFTIRRIENLLRTALNHIKRAAKPLLKRR